MSTCKNTSLFSLFNDERHEGTPAETPRENDYSDERRAELVHSMLARVVPEAAIFCRSIGRADLANDFEGEGQLALVVASRSWFENRGVSFSTFAVSVMRNFFRRYATGIEQAGTMEDWGGVSGPSPDAGNDDDDSDAMSPRPVRKPNGYQCYLLSLLPEENRAIVRDSVFGGFTLAELADQHGRTLKDVKLIVRNSFATIAKQLEYEDSEEDLFFNHPDNCDYSEFEGAK
jgi:DNA-directed RNA polymerase specialized sigma24 family protein